MCRDVRGERMRISFAKKVKEEKKEAVKGTVEKIIENPTISNSPSNSPKFWAMPQDEVLTLLGTSENGLDSANATERLKRYGKNVIAEKKEFKTLRILLSQLSSPFVYVLIAAALISFFIGDAESSIIIIALVALSAGVSFFQEYKSEQSIEKLKKYLTFYATVWRDNRMQDIDVSELVPGDIVDLSVGDRVPADIRLLESENLRIDESILTGEHYPVKKHTEPIDRVQPIPQEMANIAFAGSIVREGHGKGVVIATGTSTYFGKTALLIESIKDESEFQKELRNFSSLLLRVILLSIFFVLIVNIFTGHGLFVSLLFAVALAVGLIPEPLPFVTTLSLTKGALKLAQKGVIVKRLSATEDLGNIDILCCDKTGTLTENRITVKDYFDVEGKKADNVLLYGLLCNSVRERKSSVSGNAIDVAIFEYTKIQPSFNVQLKEYNTMHYVPFDYERRRMSVIVQTTPSRQKSQKTKVIQSKKENYLFICKGAPEAVLAVASSAKIGGKIVDIKKKKKEILDYQRDLSEKGYRVIAIAVKTLSERDMKKIKERGGPSKEDEHDLTLIGFILLSDPPKKSVKETLALANKYNVKIKIITGDGAAITKTIANQVGFVIKEDEILEGAEIDKIIDSNQLDKIEKTVIFARVTPEQKLKIIRALRSRGHVVGFIGDGVNDAPPLREADVGIAVDTGADVAKEAADIILLKKSLHVVIDGILEGRGIFVNIVKYLRCTFAGNFGNLYTVAIASPFLRFVPLLPTQILFLNFITDAPLLTISADNVDKEELQKPKRWDVKRLVRNGAILGAISTVFDLILIILILNVSEGLFQSLLFLELVLSGIFVILSLRTTKPIWLSNKPSRYLIAAIIIIALVGVVAVFPPFSEIFKLQTPPDELLLLAIAVAVGYAIATECAKYIIYMKKPQFENVSVATVSE